MSVSLFQQIKIVKLPGISFLFVDECLSVFVNSKLFDIWLEEELLDLEFETFLILKF